MWRVGVWIIPIIVFFITRSAAAALQRSGAHPLRGWQGEVVGALRTARSRCSPGARRRARAPTGPPVGTVPGRESER